MHVEDHLLLTLPMPADDRPRTRVDPAGYDVVTWRDRCPEEYVEAYCAMRTRMTTTSRSATWTTSSSTDRGPAARGGGAHGASYASFAAARRRADGVFGGYSLTYLAHGTDHALQDDTLVMPAHRGRRLGAALKAATLAACWPSYPDRVASTPGPPRQPARCTDQPDFGYRPGGADARDAAA